MVCFGAVRLDNELQTTFYAKTRPISEYYNDEALAVSGFSRQEHESFEDPKVVFEQFLLWLEETSTSGFKNDMRASWKHMRYLSFTDKEGRDHKGFPHTHNPLEDALGNAHALLYMINEGIKLKI